MLKFHLWVRYCLTMTIQCMVFLPQTEMLHTALCSIQQGYTCTLHTEYYNKGGVVKKANLVDGFWSRHNHPVPPHKSRRRHIKSSGISQRFSWKSWQQSHSSTHTRLNLLLQRLSRHNQQFFLIATNDFSQRHFHLAIFLSQILYFDLNFTVTLENKNQQINKLTQRKAKLVKTIGHKIVTDDIKFWQCLKAD